MVYTSQKWIATAGLDSHPLAGDQTVEGLPASDAQAAEVKTLKSQCAPQDT